MLCHRAKLSGHFCRLLTTFANSLDPDQDQQNVGPFWIRTAWHSDSIPDFFFEKSQQLTTKA